MRIERGFDMTVGDRIKKKRIELGLSQDEVAQKVGYKSRSSIQKIESSRRLPLSKIELMSRALDCSPGYLMGWEDEESIPKDIIDYYIQQDADQELLAAYHNANPEVRQMIDYLLKSSQSGVLPHNSNDGTDQ